MNTSCLLRVNAEMSLGCNDTALITVIILCAIQLQCHSEDAASLFKWSF